ncbi:MAG TPA: phosphatase PAP2 family protein [Opitutaceae bacterium]
MKFTDLRSKFLVLASGLGALSLPISAQPAGTGEGTANVMLGTRETARFVRVQDLDFPALLPPPPPAGSISAAADLDTVLQVQSSRTAQDVAWATTIEKDDVFLNREIVGDWMEASNLPVTAGFFRSLASDLKAVDAASKLPFQRRRPYEVDARVKPCVSRPASSSYPSGSALQALVWAELLSELLPAKREALLQRAYRAAWGRVIGGVHFPSDIEAGRRLAAPFLKACRASPEFRARFEAVREEFAAVHGK